MHKSSKNMRVLEQCAAYSRFLGVRAICSWEKGRLPALQKPLGSFSLLFSIFIKNMAREHIVAGVDVGNAFVRTVVAMIEKDKKELHLLGVGVSPSLGMRKGSVVDPEELASNVAASVEDAERMSGVPVPRVVLGVSGTHVGATASRGVVAVAGRAVSAGDVDRALSAAEAVSLPQNRTRLRTIPREFTVDGQKGIKNPVNLSGIRLEVDAHIFSGQTQNIENLEAAVAAAGVDIEETVPALLACAEAVIERRQRELGVVCVDIGSDSTSIVVFEDGVPLHASVIPVGGTSVTNDIAIGLRMSVDAAERVKIEYGNATPNDIKEGETIDLGLISKLDSQKISKKQLATIIQARYYEIFLMIKDELRKIGREGALPAGVVLTGGAVKMNGALELGREALRLPIQVGFPSGISGIVDKVDDPNFATAVGLCLWGTRHESPRMGLPSLPNVGKIFSSITSFFRNMLP